MSQRKLILSPEKIQAFSLESLRVDAEELNRRNRELFNLPFPKPPERWLSCYQFQPYPVEFLSSGEVEGGLSWLLGYLFDFSFTRAVFAPYYSNEGGHCFDPVSLFVLELCVKVDSYPEYASFCSDLRQGDKGKRYRELAGIFGSIPDAVDLHNFRDRVGNDSIDRIMGDFVDFFTNLGLIQGKLVATDGQLIPSYSRYKGCTHACEGCLSIPLDHLKGEILLQLKAGVKRIQITCPFAEVVGKVIASTAKRGKPKEPKVSLMEVQYLDSGVQDKSLIQMLGAEVEELPPLKIKWNRLRQTEEGSLLLHCSKAPSDLEAKRVPPGCYHVDNQNPEKKEAIFGYNHQRTTDINEELAPRGYPELPVGISTYPANENEGSHFIEHRSSINLAVTPGQVQVVDGSYDGRDNYTWLRQRKAIPIIAYNPRRENLSAEAFLAPRGYPGYDQNGTPYAPCGRLCRSNGYNYQIKSRQYVCANMCAREDSEQWQKCPHGEKVLGFSKRMSVKNYPRLTGEVQRGTQHWQTLYNHRSASERINSYDQEVIRGGKPLRMRGLKAFSFAGAMRTLAQMLRRALEFVMGVTFSLGRLLPLRA